MYLERGTPPPPPPQAGLAADACLPVEAMNVSHARVSMDRVLRRVSDRKNVWSVVGWLGGLPDCRQDTTVASVSAFCEIPNHILTTSMGSITIGPSECRCEWRDQPPTM